MQNYVWYISVSLLVGPLLEWCTFVTLCCCGQGQFYLLARMCTQGRLIFASERMYWPNCQWAAELSQQCKIIIKKEKGKKKEKQYQRSFPRELCKLAGSLLIALQMLWVVRRQLPLNGANGRTAGTHHVSTASRLENTQSLPLRRGKSDLPCHLLAVPDTE